MAFEKSKRYNFLIRKQNNFLRNCEGETFLKNEEAVVYLMLLLFETNLR